jgi:outer membrane immunogenic protein
VSCPAKRTRIRCKLSYTCCSGFLIVWHSRNAKESKPDSVPRHEKTDGPAYGLAKILNANAADLPPPSVAPIYIPPPTYFTWAGPYLGATVGFANGFHSYDDLAGAFLGYPGLSNDQSKGFAAGGTLGFNLQARSFVYGIEADLSWLSNKSTYVDPNGAINNFYPSETNRLNDLGTVRGRLGLAVDRKAI